MQSFLKSGKYGPIGEIGKIGPYGPYRENTARWAPEWALFRAGPYRALWTLVGGPYWALWPYREGPIWAIDALLLYQSAASLSSAYLFSLRI